MTLPISRPRSRGPITWLTLIGVLLLPALIGGILVAALQNPTERLDAMTAAVVNLDKPVTIDDQYTPLGRQLTAGLVDGSDDFDSNLTWVVSNEDDAAEGLADGRYQAIVTIPRSFSADATSSGTALKEGGSAADQAERARITVTTPPDGRVADDLITQQIASVAASSLGTMLSEATIGNVLVGFNTLGEQIGEAADGASQLADGAQDAADGAAEIPGGADQLADGAGELANGSSQLAGGADQLASGANDLSGGLDTIAAKAREAGAGATQLGQGLLGGAATLERDGIVPSELLDAANGAKEATAGVKEAADGAATATAGVQQGVSGLSQQLAALAAECDRDANAEFCGRLDEATGLAGGLVEPSTQAAQAAGAASQYADPAAQAAAGTADGLTQLSAEAPKAIAGQLRTAGEAATQLGGGLGQLAEGVDQSADGARGLSGGAQQLASGNRGLSSGANQIGEGATALGEGADELANGLGSLASGTGDLADGLDTASESLPSFSDDQTTSLAAVIADPVKADGASTNLFGPTAIPLLAAVALWFGALASFIALRAVPGSVLTSRRSSIAMVLRGLWPAAAIGAGQGVLVSLIVQIVAHYDAATWWGFAGVAVLAGVAFAAINQALVAVLGGIGRWISALIGVITIATGLISTMPDWLAGLGDALPTAPALNGLIEPSGGAVTALIVWGVLSLVAATIAVTTRRTTNARTVLAAA